MTSLMYDRDIRGDFKFISFRDKLALIAEVLLPTVAKGILLRRPSVMALADRLNIDKRAVRRLQKIRAKYGTDAVMVQVLGKKHALILSPEDLTRVLADAPTPFTPASEEKKAALGQFEPHVSLISKGGDRAIRRRLNDQVLESGCPNHSLAHRFSRIASEEALRLVSSGDDKVTWSEFAPVWDRIVRRVVLGDGAADDIELTEQLKALRAAGNWSILHPRRVQLFHDYSHRLDEHISRAEPGSLAATLIQTAESEMSAPSSQATHWLFAFDAGGIATFSALALLSSHPAILERAIADAEGRKEAIGPAAKMSFPFLRACLLEALRLWPTTMIVHRQSTQETNWANGIMPSGTSVLIFAPYFHRDDQRFSFAHQFAPDIWMEEPGKTKLPFVPFSAGPGVCPGRHVVLLTGSAMLAALLKAHRLLPSTDERLRPGTELPSTLNHFDLVLSFLRSGSARRNGA